MTACDTQTHTYVLKSTMGGDSCSRLCFSIKCHHTQTVHEFIGNWNGKTMAYGMESWRSFNISFEFIQRPVAALHATYLVALHSFFVSISANRYGWTGLLLFAHAVRHGMGVGSSELESKQFLINNNPWANCVQLIEDSKIVSSGWHVPYPLPKYSRIHLAPNRCQYNWIVPRPIRRSAFDVQHIRTSDIVYKLTKSEMNPNGSTTKRTACGRLVLCPVLLDPRPAQWSKNKI